MPSARAIAWIERLTWILIYIGLFAIVLGLVTLPHSATAGWSLMTAGGLLAAGGVILVWLRSRLDQGIDT